MNLPDLATPVALVLLVTLTLAAAWIALAEELTVRAAGRRTARYVSFWAHPANQNRRAGLPEPATYLAYLLHRYQPTLTPLQRARVQAALPKAWR